MHFVAKKPGDLPPADGAVVAGVKLPPGARPMPKEAFLHPARAVKTSPLWVSAAPIPDVKALVAPLIAAFPKTGLWPVVLESFDGEPRRPWLDGEFDPSGAGDLAQDAAGALAWLWDNVRPDEDDDEGMAAVAPFARTFPGLAARTPGAPNDGRVAEVIGRLEGSLGLAAVTRPADFVAAVGWLGPLNHMQDMGMLAAVLRSWEDRFDAYVVGVGADTLSIAVGRPPRDPAHAKAIAAEHFAVCSGIVYQGEGSIEAYAGAILNAPAWSLWWD